MDPVTLISKRTGMSMDEAAEYMVMAEDRIRDYLKLEPGSDMRPYKYAVIDIAVLYWQFDKAVKQSGASIGYSKESFQEGGVTHTVAALSGSAIWSTYDGAINGVLASLDEKKTGKVIFL